MNRNGSLDNKFFFTQAGHDKSRSSLGRDTSQRTLPPNVQPKVALRDRYDKLAKLSGMSGHQKSQAELPKQLNPNPSEDELIKDRPSAQLPVTLSFGDMTINDQSMIGSTVPRMMR